MNNNFQGRHRGKSVSFRGQSNDSNFYDSRPRNDNSNSFDGRPRNAYRDQYSYEGNNQYMQDDERIVKLLPDANMTISVPNDFKAMPRGRPRGSRGILKSHSFRDDSHLPNRSNEFSNYRQGDHDDFKASERRGFEAHAFQSGRSRGRGRGFSHNTRPQHNDGPNDQDTDQSFSQPNDKPRGRGKPFRRGRGGRGRGRFMHSSDGHNNGPTAGDGDKDEDKHTATEDDCTDSHEINGDLNGETHAELDSCPTEGPTGSETVKDSDSQCQTYEKSEQPEESVTPSADTVCQPPTQSEIDNTTGAPDSVTTENPATEHPTPSS